MCPRRKVILDWKCQFMSQILVIFRKFYFSVSIWRNLRLKLSKTYGETAISERTCRESFQRFKNGDFDIKDRHGGRREKVFKNAELEALLHEDSCQTQEELDH